MSHHVTVLLVEDNADHAVLIRLAAERALPGLDVHVARDGREAIDYLAGSPPFEDREQHPRPDLVILDLLMPRVDGFGVLEWIGSQPGMDPMPVVILTSSVNPADETKALALGARAFHSKPGDLLELAELVKAIVDEHVS